MSSDLLSAVLSGGSALVVAAVTGIAAIYAARIATHLGQQVALRTTERRMAAYADLWNLTAIASPSRQKPISEPERRDLYDEITLGWYYRNGNGMVLSEPTRTLYLRTLDNMACSDTDLFPETLRASLPDDLDERETWRGNLTQDQLSLLRTQMKQDLSIFGVVYSGRLAASDEEFLTACGLDISKEPWSRSRATASTIKRKGYSRLTWFERNR